LQECMTQALRAAGWSAEPWVQKVVRLPPAEFTYKPGADPDGSTAEVPNFLLVEVLLPRPRPKAEKEAFWVELRAAVEARLRSKEPDLVLGFVEFPGENLYYNRIHHHFDCDSKNRDLTQVEGGPLFHRVCAIT
jgi:hypothetical protein